MANQINLIDEQHFQARLSECVLSKNHQAVTSVIYEDIRKQVIGSLVSTFAGNPEKMDFLYQQFMAQEKSDDAPFDFIQMVQREFGDDENTDQEKIENLCDQVINAILDKFHSLDEQFAALMQMIGLVNYCLKSYEQYLQKRRKKVADYHQQGVDLPRESLVNDPDLEMPFKKNPKPY